MGRSKSTLEFTLEWKKDFNGNASVRMDLGRIRSGRESVHVLFKESSLN